MELSVMVWNVRGLNGDQKQQQIKAALKEQKVDLALLNETRLKTTIEVSGYQSVQTLVS